MDPALLFTFASLPVLLAPMLTWNWRSLGVVTLVGAAVPAAIVIESQARPHALAEAPVEGLYALVVFYCAVFLAFFVFPVIARALGLRLQASGWSRLGALGVDVIALSPALGCFGVLIADAMLAAA